ncbi:MAG: T9SS type A sorting domain-containing protein [Bacteroidia bacterium]
MKKLILITFSMLVAGYALAQAGINFDIRNAQTNGNTYEFDVFMSANQQGTLNSHGQVYVNYNTAVFGANIATAGQVTALQTGLLNQVEPQTGVPKYMTVNVADNANGIFAITWQSNFASFPASPAFQAEVPVVATPIYHVVMTMSQPTTAPVVSFNNQLMTGQQFYQIQATTQHIPYSQFASLPVELLAFDATKINEDVQLNWTTSREINNDHFIIEKATDVGAFEPIAKVDGQGTTEGSSEYVYTDKSAMGLVNAYRLKQVDIDGTYTYSEIIEVTFDAAQSEALLVYPVPAREHLNVMIGKELDSKLTLNIFNTAGKLVWTGNYETTDAKVDISILPAGNYTIQAQAGQFQQSKQFIKID